MRIKLVDALPLGLADDHRAGERASVTGVMVGHRWAERAGVLGRVRGSLAGLGGCAALDAEAQSVEPAATECTSGGCVSVSSTIVQLHEIHQGRVEREDKPLETPLVDPIDLVSGFAGAGPGLVKAGVGAIRRLAGREMLTEAESLLVKGTAANSDRIDDATETTYEILDGMRRSKAVEIAGDSTIQAEVLGSGGKIIDVSSQRSAITKVNHRHVGGWVDPLAQHAASNHFRIEVAADPRSARQPRGSYEKVIVQLWKTTMVRDEKLANALYALNAVLVVARHMAASGRAASDIAEVLDTAEYLPRLLAEAEDRTEEFRENLVSLASKYTDFTVALERYDRTVPARW
ncbi:hypothetical protein WME76_12120 [Sorangium sp. So ce119]|uniref:hypothetical protein n=1 Tax=Sorangium sp. So ce119 TaxID=3133279 RepID=UPI003F5F429B